MGPLLAGTISLALVALGLLPAGHAADTCVPDVGDAESALARALRAGHDAQKVNQAEGLVSDAEAACRRGDMILASRKAQEALGILNSAPGPGQGRGATLPPSKAPGPTRPGDAEPMFIGPTGKTQTGEYGFGAWIAPTTPTGNDLTRGGQGGTPSAGFTFTWGSSPRRTEAPQSP